MQTVKKIFKQIDLTIGSPYKALFFFALPLFLYQLLSSSFSLVNSLVLKQTVGGNSVAAINSTSSISLLIFQFAYGCSCGFTIMISEAFGKKDEQKLKKAFYNAIYLCIGIGTFITILGTFSYKALLTFLKIDSIYFEQAANYYQILLIGFIFALLSYYFANILRAVGDSFAPLVISFITTLVNIILAFLLTAVIKLDTRGVAIATVLSNFLSVVISFVYINKKYSYFKHQGFFEKIDWTLCFRMLRVGLPLGFQWSILFFGSFFQARTINAFGNGLATKAASCYSSFEGYITILFSTISNTLLNYVGQNFGKRDINRIKIGLKAMLITATIIWLILFASLYFIVDYVPYIFLPAGELNNYVEGPIIVFYCSTYLKTILSLFFLQGYLSIFRVVLQGIQKTMLPFISGIGELIARIAVCAILPTLINPNNPTSNESYIGVCFATPAAWLFSAIIMGIGVFYYLFHKKDCLFNLSL